MITSCPSVFCFPSYIDAEPLFKQMKGALYNSRSPLLQANARFLSNMVTHPPPYVDPQAVRNVVKQFDLSKYVNIQA